MESQRSSKKKIFFPYQIDETLKERQMKYSKIVEGLDRILYFIGNQGISYRRTQETQTQKDAKNT